MYLDDFVWVLGNWEFKADDLNNFSFPRFRGYVPTGKSKFVLDFSYLGSSSKYFTYFIVDGLTFLSSRFDCCKIQR